MKINEIVTESQLRKSASASIPGAKKWNGLDNSSPYHAFRFGIALAGAPDKEMPLDGPFGQKLLTIGYSDADNEIIKATADMFGFDAEQLTPEGSTESDSVNNTSPVKACGPVQLKKKK